MKVYIRICHLMGCILCTLPLLAQPGVFHAKVIKDLARNATMAHQFKDVTLFELDARGLNAYVEGELYPGSITTIIGDQFHWDFILSGHDITGPDFYLNLATPQGMVKQRMNKNITYRGHLKSNPESQVRFVISDAYLMGYISDGTEEYIIEPAHFFDRKSPENHFVVYRNSDLIDSSDHYDCSFLDDPHQAHEPILQGLEKLQTARNSSCKTTELAIALDYSYVSANGGETSAVNKAIGVMNTVDLYFDNSFSSNVDFDIVEIFVSTCAECDPSAWTNTLDALALLNNFGSWAESTGGFSHVFDLGQIWTNRNIEYEENPYVVGLAWRPGVCYSKFHLLEDYTNNHNKLSTLTAHEIGHNFGSKHDTIAGHIMYPSVNGSGSWSQLSKDAVNTLLAYAPCLSDCGSCPTDMVVSNDGNGTYEAAESVYTNGITTVSTSALYSAPNVTLFPDFIIMQGAVLEIQGDGCD